MMPILQTFFREICFRNTEKMLLQHYIQEDYKGSVVTVLKSYKRSVLAGFVKKSADSVSVLDEGFINLCIHRPSSTALVHWWAANAMMNACLRRACLAGTDAT